MKGQMNLNGAKIKNREIPNDVFITPNKLAIDLIKEVPLLNNEIVYDPFKGTGSFYNNFVNIPGEWAEIEKGRDFFSFDASYKYGKNPDWIISNPPFSILSDVLIHSTNIVKKGFAYIMPTYSLTYHRINTLSEYGFNLSKIVFFKNPSEWGIGFQMCFVIFSKKNKKDIFDIKTLDLSSQLQSKLPIQ